MKTANSSESLVYIYQAVRRHNTVVLISYKSHEVCDRTPFLKLLLRSFRSWNEVADLYRNNSVMCHQI